MEYEKLNVYAGKTLNIDLRQLKKEGWEKISMGTYPSSETIKEYDDRFALFIRKMDFNDFSKKSLNPNGEKPHNTAFFQSGLNDPIARQQTDLTPQGGSYGFNSFDMYKSLQMIRSPTGKELVISFDSEWWDDPRQMISWQFSLVYQETLIEFLFFRRSEACLWLELALGCILDHIMNDRAVDVDKIRRYKACDAFKSGRPITKIYTIWKEAYNHSKYIYKGGQFVEELIADQDDRFLKRSERDWAYFHTYLDYSLCEKIRMILLCHSGKADLSALDQDKKNRIPLLRSCSEVQGGLVTVKFPIRLSPRSCDRSHGRNKYIYPISLSVRDTMCHAPANRKRLSDLGNAIGIPKVCLPEQPIRYIEHMDVLLEADPVLFFHYASNDAVVTLLYAIAIYGVNSRIPVTLTSAAAKVMKAGIMIYLGTDEKNFNRTYRGLETVSHGKVKKETDHILESPFIEATSLEPISDRANLVQYYASQSYHGGYNSCSRVGYFPWATFDYDLKNAYPTAMCLVPDIDWEAPIKFEIRERFLTLSDWHLTGDTYAPLLPFFAYVRFDFPESVLYPCIPVKVDGIPVFPLSSRGHNGIYAVGPEIFLALTLGAEVYCETGFFLNTRKKSDGSESYSMRSAVCQMVKDRAEAKKVLGKGSLGELVLKFMVNSVYGKTAQNVIQKSSWSAYKDEMEILGCSSITNPVSASMITSIVRAELIAVQNQIHALGFECFCVTTDGMISDIPFKKLQSLDLYSIRSYIEQARFYLTGGADQEIWEIKHAQDDLLCFTTRGNISLYTKTRPYIYDDNEYVGVCAHNGVRTGQISGSYEDRLSLFLSVISRDGPVPSVVKHFTKFKLLVKGAPFGTITETSVIRMDYDLKRKPVRDSIENTNVFIDDVEYEIACFETMPYQDTKEFEIYRMKKESMNVLRTKEDWESFFNKIDSNGSGARPRDIKWAILFSCVMGHRAGLWLIPGLTKGTVTEKCVWLNQHNDSKKEFRESDWKNARRPDYQSRMLPREMLKEKLGELICDS